MRYLSLTSFLQPIVNSPEFIVIACSNYYLSIALESYSGISTPELQVWAIGRLFILDEWLILIGLAENPIIGIPKEAKKVKTISKF
jgi:hypothetical protein